MRRFVPMILAAFAMSADAYAKNSQPASSGEGAQGDQAAQPATAGSEYVNGEPDTFELTPEAAMDQGTSDTFANLVASGPPGGTIGWTRTFEDNFDFFDSNKWRKAWPAGNGYPASAVWTGDRIHTHYQADGAHVSVANGKLYIKTERKAQGRSQFTSGVVTTAGTPSPFMQKYGYFEVRMKPATTPGNDPDFWAFPLSPVPAGGSQYKEIDFAEFGGRGGVMAMTSHMPFVKPDPSFYKLGNWTSDFRTYGVLWEPGRAILYIDGVEQGQISGNIVDEAGVLIISDEVRVVGDDQWFGNSNNFVGPVTTEVDWVRVWRRN